MKIAYHVPTKELWIKKVQEWLDEGKVWVEGDRETVSELWDDWREKSCVTLDFICGKIGYGRKQFYLSKGFKIMPVEKTLETLEVGDVIVHRDRGGEKRLILSAQGEGGSRLYHLSAWFSDDKDPGGKYKYGYISTAFELERDKYSIYQEEKQSCEVTMEEVCEKFGEDVKIKK